MVDTKELEKLIKKTGKKKGYIADRIGITLASLGAKLRGESDFKMSEAEALCKELGINTGDQIQAIFFVSK